LGACWQYWTLFFRKKNEWARSKQMNRIVQRIQTGKEFEPDEEDKEDIIYDSPDGLYYFTYWPREGLVSVSCIGPYACELFRFMKMQFTAPELCGLSYAANIDADTICPVCWRWSNFDLYDNVIALCSKCAMRAEEIRSGAPMMIFLVRAMSFLPPELTSVIVGLMMSIPCQI
jgi:hypothetical protein